MQTQRRHPPRAFFTVEAIAGVITMGVVMTALAAVISNFNDGYDQLIRRAAAWHAAESTCERLRAGAAYTTESFTAAYPDMTLRENRSPGDGDWQGFTQVTVTIQTHTRRGHKIEVTLSTYLPAEISK